MEVELKSRKTGCNLQVGAEVPFKSNYNFSGRWKTAWGRLSCHIAGQNTYQTWSKDQWRGCRVHASCFQVGNRWIQGGVIYGIATQTAESRAKTNQLCSLLEERLLDHSQGLRFIAGDFNQEHGNLESVNRWLDKGWINKCTTMGRAKTWKTNLANLSWKNNQGSFVLKPGASHVLARCPCRPTYFADHACLWAEFRDLGKPP